MLFSSVLEYFYSYLLYQLQLFFVSFKNVNIKIMFLIFFSWGKEIGG